VVVAAIRQLLLVGWRYAARGKPPVPPSGITTIIGRCAVSASASRRPSSSLLTTRTRRAGATARQVIAVGIEAVGREDAHVGFVRERRAVDPQLRQTGRELLSGPQLESGGVCRCHRHDEQGSNEYDQQAECERGKAATALDHAIAP